MRQKKEAAILYSGGLDSSAVTAVYANLGYSPLHLLTFDNGGESNIDLSRIKIPQFKARFKDIYFKHEILPTKYLFKKIALDSLEDDFRRYSTNLICVGCKMAMHTETALYAIKKGINLIADGFVKRQEEFPEQDITFVNRMRKFHKNYGINYVSPIYEKIKTKSDIKDLLFRYDLSTKSIEPNCLFGGTFSPANKSEIGEYFDEKQGLLEKYIEEQLEELNEEI